MKQLKASFNIDKKKKKKKKILTTHVPDLVHNTGLIDRVKKKYPGLQKIFLP